MRGFFDAHGDEPFIRQAAIESAQHRTDFLANHNEEVEDRIASQQYRAAYSRGYEAFRLGLHQNPHCANTESAGFIGWKDGHNEAKYDAEKEMA